MNSIGLSGVQTVAFAVLMVLAMGLLGYVGWLMVANSGAAPALVDPPTAEPTIIAVPDCAHTDVAAEATAGGGHEVQVLDVDGASASGLAYLPESRTLAMIRQDADGAELVEVTLFGDAAGTSNLPVDGATDITVRNETLMVLESEEPRLSFIAGIGTGSVPSVDGSIDIRGADADTATGIFTDPATDEVVVVDAGHSRLVRLILREPSRRATATTEVSAACQVVLPPIGEVTGLEFAIRQADGHIFAMADDGILHEMDGGGTLLGERDLSSIGMGAVQGMAFAPSADLTDPEEVEHLYVLSSDDARPRIHTVSFAEPAAPAAVENIDGAVVGRIQTSELAPPSSDPGGAAYDWAGGRLIVTDSEIDELPEYAGHTVFALDEAGQWSGLGSPVLSDEITDVAIDPDSGEWFFTDDSAKEIIRMTIGDDGLLGTRDDTAALISTSDFGSLDPEGITVGQGSLFISDGAAAEVYRLTPGADGIFNGVAPVGDDQVASFDTAAVGVADPEGIAFDRQRGTLLVRGRDRHEPIIEVATDGTLLTVVALDPDALRSAGGIALVPSSDGSGGLNAVIADRGADNGRSDAPNDGQLVEVRIVRPSVTGAVAGSRPW